MRRSPRLFFRLAIVDISPFVACVTFHAFEPNRAGIKYFNPRHLFFEFAFLPNDSQTA